MIPSTTPPLPPKQGQTLAGTLVWEYFLSVCNSTVSGLKLVLVHDTVHRHYTAYMKHYEIKKKTSIYISPQFRALDSSLFSHIHKQAPDFCTSVSNAATLLISKFTKQMHFLFLLDLLPSNLSHQKQDAGIQDEWQETEQADLFLSVKHWK